MTDTVTVRLELDDRHVTTWRERVCEQLLDAEAPWTAGQQLGMRFDVAAGHGIVQLGVNTRTSGLAIARSAARVAREERPPAMGLTLVTSGESQIVTRGREHVVRAGELCLLSSYEPFAKRMSADYSERFLYLPVPMALALGRPVPVLTQHTLIAPARGLGRMLAASVSSLATLPEDMSPAEWQAALGATFELAAGVFGQPDPERLGQSTRDMQLARALRYIEAHLAEPELSPSSIAGGLGMSLRYLHLVFERRTSVGATILARRLDRCRAALGDPADRRSISEIAFAWGFNDAAHFSRTFRARFGVSPRDYRAAR